MIQQRCRIFLFSILFLTLVTGCENNLGEGVGTGPAVGFVVTTDFAVGNLSTLTTDLPRQVTKSILGSTGLHSDIAIRTFENFIFILQRFGSNSIVVIDSNNPGASIANYTTNDPGENAIQSNLHDIAFVSLSKAYISRYALNTILIVNPRTGAQLGTIDLSTFADADGVVEMDQMVIVNGKLYVSLQRLNRNKQLFPPENDSFVVVIDTNTDNIIDVDAATPGVQAIVLEGRNPFSRLTYLSETNKIYLVNAGTFSTADNFGGIEVINPDTNKSEGIVISDNDLGGPIGGALAIFSETVAYVTISDANFNNVVIPVNLSTLGVSLPLIGAGPSFIPSLAFDKNGDLYIPDRDATNPGIQVFDTTTNTKLEGPIDTGLPPFELVFATP